MQPLSTSHSNEYLKAFRLSQKESEKRAIRMENLKKQLEYIKNRPSVAKQRSGKEHGFPKQKTTLPAVDSPDKKQRVDEDTDMFDLKDADNAILMPVHGIHTRRIKTVRKDDRRRNRVITQPRGVPHRNERVESGQHTPYERFYLSSGLSIPT